MGEAQTVLVLTTLAIFGAVVVAAIVATHWRHKGSVRRGRRTNW